jgi:hypothetical protein
MQFKIEVSNRSLKSDIGSQLHLLQFGDLVLDEFCQFLIFLVFGDVRTITLDGLLLEVI